MNREVDITREELLSRLTRAESRIKELETAGTSRQLFYTLIDASPVPYALNDEHLNITYLNPAFVKTFGYNMQELQTLDDWWPRAYPDENYRKWVISTWRNNLEEFKNGNKPFEPIEFSIRCKDGNDKTVLASMASLPVVQDGTHLVILYDITDRKKAENALLEQEHQMAEIIDHLPSVVFMKEASELRYVHFNKAGEELTGIKREDIIGKNDYDLWPKKQAEFFVECDRVVLESGKLEDIPDEPLDTPGGTRRLHTRKVAINDDDGKPKYLLGISDDITGQTENNKEHERLQRELQQAHKMESLGHLAGGIAHDFNNLLNIISGYTRLAYDKGKLLDDEKLPDYLQQVMMASDRATNLVSQMLSFSRNEDTRVQPVDLSSLVQDDVSMLRATLPSTIEITTQIEQDLPYVLMDPTQLNQVLMNLAVNARDAMDSSGELTVRLAWARNLDTESFVSHKPVKGDWIELSVSDTGTGIEASILDDIFTPFFTRKTVGEGTGMGLAVIYGIMKAHNGHILLDTEVGKGTTFRLLFPPVEENGIQAHIQEMSSDAIILGNGKTVLVVDDEPSLANMIGDLMDMRGYKADVFTNSMEALACFKKDPDRYAMLITDQTMPKLTGLELLAQVRNIKPGMPVILCSGFSDKINEAALNEMNVEYFKKPIKINRFMKKVNNLLAAN